MEIQLRSDIFKFSFLTRNLAFFSQIPTLEDEIQL